MLQSRLLHSEDMERELRQLQEENTALHNHTDNVGLMRYQLQTLREQAERNEGMERRALRLEEENQSLREQVARLKEGRGEVGSRYVVCLLYSLRDI